MKYEPERPSKEHLSTKVPSFYDPNGFFENDNDYSFSQRMNANKKKDVVDDDDDFEEEEDEEENNEKEEL